MSIYLLLLLQECGTGDENNSTVTGFFKCSKTKHVLKNVLDEKAFYLQVSIVFTCFTSKKSQNKLDLMQNVYLKRLTKLVKIHFEVQHVMTIYLTKKPVQNGKNNASIGSMTGQITYIDHRKDWNV